MRSLFLLTALFSTIFSFAREREDSTEMLLAALAQIDSIEAKLHYKTGKVTLENGMATINIAPASGFWMQKMPAMYWMTSGVT